MKKALVLATLLLLTVSAISVANQVKTEKVTMKVYPNDSVWKIATRVQKQYRDPRDIREIVYYIVKDNNLKQGGYVDVGQKLVVNVIKESD